EAVEQGVVGLEDLAHRALADLADDLVFADLLEVHRARPAGPGGSAWRLRRGRNIPSPRVTGSSVVPVRLTVRGCARTPLSVSWMPSRELPGVTQPTAGSGTDG